MFATFADSTIIKGAAPRRGNGVSSPLRLVSSNNTSCCNPPERAVPRHVVASTGRLECSWSEQPSDGAALEPPKPGRRRGRVGHGATNKNRPPRRITRRAA
jgi:hypothetical protein